MHNIIFNRFNKIFLLVFLITNFMPSAGMANKNLLADDCIGDARAFNHSSSIPIGDFSLARGIDDYESFYAKLSELLPTSQNLVSLFIKEYDRPPKIRDIWPYVEKKLNKMVINLKEFGRQYPMTQIYSGQFIDILEKRISEKRISEIHRSYAGDLNDYFDANILQHKAFHLNFIVRNFGALGEFNILMRIDYLIGANFIFNGRGLKQDSTSAFYKLYNSHLSTLRQELKATINEEKIQNLFLAYPNIFKKFDKQKIWSAHDFLEHLFFWLNSKEVDALTLLPDGKYQFIEIKNGHRPADLEKLKAAGKRNKNTIEKVYDMLELIKLLNLEQFISLQIIFNNGLTKEAKEALEKTGVTVRGVVY